MIWLVARGGLGNQMFGVARALLVASEHAPEILVVDGSLVERSLNHSRRLQVNEWNWPSEVCGVRMRWWIPARGLWQAGWSLPRKIWELLQLGSVNRASNLSTAMFPTILDSHSEDGADAIKARDLGLIGPLSPRSQSPSLIEATQCIRSTDIAVHVRLGDYLTFSGGSYLLSGDYYVRALEHLRVNGRLVIFSDEPAAAETFLRGVTMGQQQLSIAPPLSPVESMMLMSQHHSIVTSHSTFSFWAGFLASPQTRIVAPSRPLWKTLPPTWIPVDQ